MRDSWGRVTALAWKDAEEVARQPTLLLATIAMVAGLCLPGLLLLLVAPALLGEPLADSDLTAATDALLERMPDLQRMSGEGRAQAFLLQQFLLFGLLVPVLASLSLAAQGIIGEKQARSLEPLLATPITVTELLLGKVLTPLVLSLSLLAVTYLVYLVCMAVWGEPGVWRTLVWPHTLLLYAVLGPLVSLTALLTAAIVSARVNDARTAQQLGGVLALPVTALFVAQIAGGFLLGTGALAATAGVLVAVDLVLLWVGVRVFQRETILIRWR